MPTLVAEPSLSDACTFTSADAVAEHFAAHVRQVLDPWGVSPADVVVVTGAVAKARGWSRGAMPTCYTKHCQTQQI